MNTSTLARMRARVIRLCGSVTCNRKNVVAAVALLLSAIAHAQSPVLQRGYDSGLSGATLTEAILNTSNVAPSTFGLVFTLPVDDVVFAQPLYVPNVTINGIPHNVLYVATMSDTLYAFDADVGGVPLWKVNLAAIVGATAVPIGNYVFSGDRGIVGNLGVLSTPVIDLSTNTIYVVACTQEGGTMAYRLHAMDITTGATRQGSGVKIAGSYGGSTFDARYLLQRLSLVLAGNQVVFGFSAMQLEYAGGYVGWVMSYDKSALTQTGIFATVTTGNRGGGVWQSGRPPVVDGAGFVYLFTGNGFGSGYDGVQDFSESALKLDPTQGLKLLDWFTAGNWSYLDAQDLDLTSSGPMLIPGTNLIAGGGKSGDLYVLNTSNLGKYNANDSQVVQKLHVSTSEIRGGPVYWQRSAANGGPLMYNWGVSDRLKAFAFNGTQFATTPSSQGAETNQIYPGGILTLSANGQAAATGVVWATTAASGDAENNPPVPGVLHAYKATDVSQELWNSNMNATRDAFGNLAKFVPPVVANGRVYVGTWSNMVAVYGLLPGTGNSPDFQVAAGPRTLNVSPGASANYTVNVSSLNGFASTVSLSVSGVPNGVVASLTPANITGGSGTATLQVTVPAGQPLGSFMLTVSGMSGGTAHAASVSLSIVANPTPSIDAQAFTDNSTPRTSVAAGISTYAANELLLAFITADYLGGANTTVTGVTGGGLTWSLVRRTNVQSGTSEIWRAFAPTTLSNATVTATLSQSVASSMYVATFGGVDTSTGATSATGATASANSSSGAPAGSLVTTRANSMVFGVGNDYDNAIARAPGSGQTVVHQFLTPQGDTYWVQQLNAPVAAAGITATINDVAPATDRYNLALVEVRPPSSGVTTYSISGVLAPASLTAGSTVSLSGSATATVTADASGNYSFAGLPNGSYTVTPSQAGVTFTQTSQNVVINGNNVTGVSFTAVSAVGPGVAVDGTLSQHNLVASKTIASPTLSTTAANELLLALISTDYLSGANTTVTGVSGGGLTWTFVARANGQRGTSEIWRAFAPAALASQTVTATLSQSVVASLTVMSFTGVDTTGTNGANAIGATASASAASGAPGASLVTTRNGSLVVGVGNDYDNAIARTLGTGQKLVDQYLTGLGDTYWVQTRSAVTPTTGTTVTINDTSPTGDQYNLAIAEIRGP